MAGFGSFGYSPPGGRPELNGPVGDRWRIAGDSDTPEVVMMQLVNDEDEQVVASLAQNYAASPAVLTEIALKYPDLVHLVALNRNAPADIKDRSPLSEHTEDSIHQYLDDRAATPEQRDQFVHRYRKTRPPGGALVGDVWRSVELT